MTSQTVWAKFKARDERLSAHRSERLNRGPASFLRRFSGVLKNRHSLLGPGKFWNRTANSSGQGCNIRKWRHEGCNSNGSGLSVPVSDCVSGQQLLHPAEDEQNHPEPPAALCEYFMRNRQWCRCGVGLRSSADAAAGFLLPPHGLTTNTHAQKQLSTFPPTVCKGQCFQKPILIKFIIHSSC